MGTACMPSEGVHAVPIAWFVLVEPPAPHPFCCHPILVDPVCGDQNFWISNPQVTPSLPHGPY